MMLNILTEIGGLRGIYFNNVLISFFFLFSIHYFVNKIWVNLEFDIFYVGLFGCFVFGFNNFIYKWNKFFFWISIICIWKIWWKLNWKSMDIIVHILNQFVFIWNNLIKILIWTFLIYFFFTLQANFD